MINCSCQEQSVKIHEIRVHPINNLSRVSILPSLCFLPCQVPILTLCACVFKGDKWNFRPSNELPPKTHPGVSRVPLQLCDKLPSLELIVTFSGSVYLFSSSHWHWRTCETESQSPLSPLRSFYTCRQQSVDLTDEQCTFMLGPSSGIQWTHRPCLLNGLLID